MILNIILFVLIGISIFLTLDGLIKNDVLNKLNGYINSKNEKYYETLLKYYEKNKKIKLKEQVNYIHKINILIDRCDLRRGALINPISIVLLGIICVIFSYTLAFKFFKIVFLSIILSVPFFYMPIAILNMIAEHKEAKVEKVFLNFLLQLKNYTKINNDIVAAMQEVKTIEPLQGHVKKFLVEVESRC